VPRMIWFQGEGPAAKSTPAKSSVNRRLDMMSMI
jgi:hypothetical protein